MKQLLIIGRFLYGIGIVAIGIHQFILRDFRPEILPLLPRWPHENVAFPIVVGLALVFAGIVISGLIKIKPTYKENISLYLGFCFLVLLIAWHLPYVLIYSADKATRLDVWFGAGEALSYAGGAFVMAGSFLVESKIEEKKNNSFVSWLEKFIPLGRVFFAILMILFGFSHFVFADFVSTMVPKWIGIPLFWTYFVGVALIGSGIAIIFKIWIKQIAFLLAMMLFLFFIFFHIPDAMANPNAGGGNEIIRAMVALLFVGIALVIAVTNGTGIKKERRMIPLSN